MLRCHGTPKSAPSSWMRATTRISLSTSQSKKLDGAMRIARQPVRPVFRKRRKKCDGVPDYGMTGMFRRRVVGETMAMISGATWTPPAADSIRPNGPSDRQAQAAPYPRPTNTAPPVGLLRTSTRPSLGLRLSSMKIAGWTIHATSVRPSRRPGPPSPETAPCSPSTDPTRLPRDLTRSPYTCPTRNLPRMSLPRPRSVLQRQTAKSGTPSALLLTSRTAPPSVQFFCPLVCVKTFCAMRHPILAKV